MKRLLVCLFAALTLGGGVAQAMVHANLTNQSLNQHDQAADRG